MVACFYSGSNPNPLLPEFAQHIKYRLFSVHGAYYGTLRQWVREFRGVWTGEVMLDSGAFSAWSKGEEVTLDHVVRSYDKALEELEGVATCVWMINLDVIPGSKGRDPTPQETEEAIAESDRNYAALVRRYGDRVLPVFHQGESESRLQQVIGLHSHYICISPQNTLFESIRFEWASRVHKIIAGSRETHGLAATGTRMMREVPWRSVDSATWIQTAGFGGIRLWIPHRGLVSLQISEKSSSLEKFDSHYDNLNEADKRYCASIIEAYGLDPLLLRESFAHRALFNLRANEDFLNSIDKQDSPVQDTLFFL